MRRPFDPLVLVLAWIGLFMVTTEIKSCAQAQTRTDMMAPQPATRCANAPERAVKSCMWAAAKYHGQPYGRLLRIARCESTLRPRAANGWYYGLYQYDRDTWAETPYAWASRGSARWSAMAAAWTLKQGEGWRFSCY